MYKIVGIQNIDYVNPAGKRITGVRLHCLFDSNRVEGSGVNQIYVSSKISTENFNIGDEIEVFYNRFGNVERVIPFN